MRAFAAVFGREVFARRIIFPVAFAAGFMPLAGSLSYGWSRPSAAEGRILVALVTAAAFSLAFGLLFGGSVIAGETSEKRIAFYFSRPIPAAAIWAAKLLAVFFLSLGPALLVMVPALVTSFPRTLGNMLPEAHPGLAAAAIAGALLLVILGAHAAVTIARLRSPWVALDLLLAPALILLVVLFLRSLVSFGLAALPQGAMDLSPVLPGLAAALLVALLAASYAQVAAGRTDARRSHGAFSAVLWGILATATAALGGYAGWVASARATDLVSVESSVFSAPHGSWTLLGGGLGAGRGHGMFLFDTAGGRSLRIRSWDAAFSADGSRAAWVEEQVRLFERDRKADLLVADLASAKAVETGLTCSPWCRVALSPSGNRLAVLEGGTLAAYEISDPSNPRQLAAFTVPESTRGIEAVDEDTIRLFPRFYNPRGNIAPAALEVAELSLPSKKSLVTGRFERETLPILRLSAGGRYLLGTRDKRLTLHDGRTGTLITTLAEDLRSPQLRFLTERRIVVAGIAGSRAEMKIFLEGVEGHSATAARTIDLGPARRLVLGGEIAPGRVAISLLPFEENLPASPRAAKLVAVDAATGAVSPLGSGLVPADRFAWWYSSGLPAAEAGTPASSLFLDASGRLVRLDPATGARTVLLGKGK